MTAVEPTFEYRLHAGMEEGAGRHAHGRGHPAMRGLRTHGKIAGQGLGFEAIWSSAERLKRAHHKGHATGHRLAQASSLVGWPSFSHGGAISSRVASSIGTGLLK